MVLLEQKEELTEKWETKCKWLKYNKILWLFGRDRKKEGVERKTTWPRIKRRTD